MFYCPYCDNLKQATHGHNYCSNAGDNIESVNSNAFYLNSSKMVSGEHKSRFSVRTVINGYQKYHTDNHEHLLTDDKFLVISEGQSWESEINSTMPVEMIVVAFHPMFFNQLLHSLSKTKTLVDDPFHIRDKREFVFSHSYQSDATFREVSQRIKHGICSGITAPLYYEQLYYEMGKLILDKYYQRQLRAEQLPLKNRIQKQELLSRLGKAKEYMETHLSEPIDLHAISKHSALSQHHFLRLFKAAYQTTPHKYLVSRRMKRAGYLIDSSDKSMKDIAFAVGYQNQSAFSRAFKSHYGTTPSNYLKDQS